jgi:hypothetical protein
MLDKQLKQKKPIEEHVACGIFLFSYSQVGISMLSSPAAVYGMIQQGKIASTFPSYLLFITLISAKFVNCSLQVFY